MRDKLEFHTCGACFKASAPVIEETFTGDMPAFGRYAELSREGKLPALCQNEKGIYHVCHIGLPAEKATSP